MAEPMTDAATIAELERWLESADTPAADIASDVFILARNQHVGGEPPKYLRGNWHHLPTAYRAFLVSLVQAGIDHAKTAQ